MDSKERNVIASIDEIALDNMLLTTGTTVGGEIVRTICGVVAGILLIAGLALGQARQDTAAWNFAVSGDSRNCGDVVMPAIAAGVLRDGAAFYWHLGDFRDIDTFDEDIVYQPEHIAKPLVISDYEAAAWPDFIDSQLAPFGSIPIFLALGNHETTPPKTRADLMQQFADWFNSPAIVHQRLLDNPKDHLTKFHYHWIDRGVAFYTLDNASVDQFDSVQIRWFERVLAHDAADPRITAVVVGMHEALPDSIGASHSMNDSAFTRTCCASRTNLISTSTSWPATPTFLWTASSTRTTGARTAASCLVGSWVRRARCATRCRLTLATPTRRRPTFTATCLRPFGPRAIFASSSRSSRNPTCPPPSPAATARTSFTGAGPRTPKRSSIRISV